MKVLTITTEDPSSIPKTGMGRTNFSKLFSDLHTCTVLCLHQTHHTYTKQIHTCNKKEKSHFFFCLQLPCISNRRWTKLKAGKTPYPALFWHRCSQSCWLFCLSFLSPWSLPAPGLGAFQFSVPSRFSIIAGYFSLLLLPGVHPLS